MNYDYNIRVLIKSILTFKICTKNEDYLRYLKIKMINLVLLEKY